MSAAALLLLIRDFVVTDDDALWESLEYFFFTISKLRRWLSIVNVATKNLRIFSIPG